MEREEIERILENYCLEINTRINNLEGWESRIKNTFDELSCLHSKVIKKSREINDIISDANFVKIFFKSFKTNYTKYVQLIKSRSKYIDKLKMKNSKLCNAMGRLERRMYKINKQLDKLGID